MKLELWQSQEFERAHEARALQSLLANLREQDWDEFCLVCANFFCAGEQIDLMVIKPRAIVVVEFKDASGRVEGGENGDWLLIDSTGTRLTINPGRRNPYQQARAMRYAVAQFLSEHATAFMPLQKSIQLDFMHVAAVVCFTEYDPSSSLDLPHTPWFSVVGLDRLAEEIRVQRSPRLSFTHKEATALVRDALRLHRVEIEAPAVGVSEVPTRELVAEAVVEAEMPPKPAPCIVCGDEHTCAIPYLSGCLISSSQGRPLQELDLVVFDVETTGIDPGAGDRVVEVAAIKVSKGVVVSEFRELVNSGVPVGDTVDVHGYTDEFLRRHGKPPEEVFPEFVDFIGEDILVAHNLPFDWSFVNSELALLGMPPLQNTTIDTLDLAERLLPHLPNRKLGTVCQHFEIPLDDAHHALPDVNGTWRVLEEFSTIVENAGGCVDPERTVRFASTQGHNYDIRMINHWADVPHQVQLLRD
ncbi:MAG: exonuclease domain-containing protein, partial [Anaerolineae bacterium]